MECKCQTAIYLLAGKPELIETLWNVNTHHTTLTVPSRILELIETLWNVNRNDKSGGSDRAKRELIETLWNVNLIITLRRT